MLTSDLIEQVLIRPAQELQVDQLRILSGYCGPGFVADHIKLLEDYDLDVELHLTIGWKNSTLNKQARSLKKLANENEIFQCSYFDKYPPIHSKIYVWLRGETPLVAFQGSANYSKEGFSSNLQQNILDQCDEGKAFSYIKSFADFYKPIESYTYKLGTVEDTQPEINYYSPYPSLKNGFIELNLLDQFGNVPTKSRLNWGQPDGSTRRPFRELGDRDYYDQAYIFVSKAIHETYPQFFPQLEEHFVVETDDGEIFFAVMAQQNRKAIHTPKYIGEQDNTWLGKYFRRRLGVEQGELITKDHLLKYGRTTVSFKKIGEDLFFMDFSRPNSTAF